MENIQESNNQVEISDFRFEFHINPASFEEGGCRDAERPKWAKGYEMVWKGHGVNCCAYALNYIMSERNYTKDAPSKRRSVSDAAALQEKLGWGMTTTIDELNDFITAFPKYRVVALIPGKSDISPVFAGSEWQAVEDGKVRDKFTLYLILYKNHWGCTLSPASVVTEFKKTEHRWCHKCICAYPIHHVHNCETRRSVPKPPNKVYDKQCKKCGIYGQHTCVYFQCKSCNFAIPKGTYSHRCLVMEEEVDDEKQKYLQRGDPADGKYPALWAFDFEARIEIKHSVRKNLVDFAMDEDFAFVGVPSIDTYRFEMHTHQMNYAAAKNVFTGEMVEFFGEHAMRDFLHHCVNYNHGNNIMVAHNSSGYDTRLIFTALNKHNFTFMEKSRQSLIMRGNKFMQIRADKKLVFRDSLLHLPQSLAALAKDFCQDTRIEKGMFPHLFNSVENYEYEGPIPDLKYFDVSHCKRREDVDALIEYHQSWQGRSDWNFKKELIRYCKNDVEILCEVMLKYHNNAMQLFNMSPWFKMTAAAYVHNVFLTERGRYPN